MTLELEHVTKRVGREIHLSEIDLELEQKALEYACAQILARELDADARDTGLRDQEAQLVARERQLVERQMQELAVTRKGLEGL